MARILFRITSFRAVAIRSRGYEWEREKLSEERKQRKGKDKKNGEKRKIEKERGERIVEQCLLIRVWFFFCFICIQI